MEKLQSRLSQIKSVIPEKNWKYFHIESAENFIFHLKSIKSERTRERVERELVSFLDLIEEELKSEKELANIRKDIYINKLYNLSNLYKEELGFISKPFYPLTMLLLLGLFLFLAWVSNIYIAGGVSTLLLAVYLLHVKRKINEKRYY
jgi:type I restriction-modification system DNA methylase subunit